MEVYAKIGVIILVIIGVIIIIYLADKFFGLELVSQLVKGLVYWLPGGSLLLPYV